MENYTEETCTACNGSGEGYYDGSTCYSCKGSGTEFIENDVCEWCGRFECECDPEDQI